MGSRWQRLTHAKTDRNHLGSDALLDTPGIVAVHGTVADASTGGFTAVTAAGTKVPVTTSNQTDVGLFDPALSQTPARVARQASGNRLLPHLDRQRDHHRARLRRLIPQTPIMAGTGATRRCQDLAERVVQNSQSARRDLRMPTY